MQNAHNIVCLIGFFILLFTVICALFVIPLIEKEYFGEGNLQNGSMILDTFIKPSDDSRKLNIYFFNVLNPQEIHNGKTPIIEEIGPYVYDQIITRRITKIDKTTNKIEFFKETSYKFNHEKSGSLTDDDNITVINIPLIGILLKMESTIKKDFLDLDQLMFQAFPENENLMFLKTRVKDILFEGIEISCEKQLELVCMQVSGALDAKQTQLYKVTENKLTFSLLKHLNATEIGPFQIRTGDSGTIRGEIVSFQNRRRLTTWKSRGRCNSIEGVNLQLIPSLPHPIQRLYTFFPEFCRSFFFVFDGGKNVDGVPTYRYISNKEPFDKSVSNECFCIKSRAKLRKSALACNPKGTMDLTGCQNFSLILSYPHFYLSDVYVEGSKPEKTLHESAIFIEPRSGSVLKSSIRFQYNIKLKKFEDMIDLAQNVTEEIFPIFWSEDVLELNHNKTDYLLHKIYCMNILRVAKISFVISGVLIMLFSVVLLYCQNQKTYQNANLYPQLKKKNLISDRFMKRKTLHINKASKLY